MQLDSQIGVAANHLASRDTPAERTNHFNDNGSLLKINDSLHLLVTKLTVLTDQFQGKSQQVNVYNSSSPLVKPTMINKLVQTSNEGCSVQTKDNTVESMETESEEPEETETVLQCTVCSRTLKTCSELDNHLESVHIPSTFSGEESGFPASSAAASSGRLPSTPKTSDL